MSNKVMGVNYTCSQCGSIVVRNAEVEGCYEVKQYTCCCTDYGMVMEAQLVRESDVGSAAKEMP